MMKMTTKSIITNSIQVLDGQWSIARDANNEGKGLKWFKLDDLPENQATVVPSLIQQVFPDYHGVAWFCQKFIPEAMFTANDQAFLKFEFVDYYAEVWLNGVFIGSHEGGELPFELDITDILINNNENLLSVRIVNPTNEEIDGWIMDQTPHRNKVPKGVVSGSIYNYGGIIRPIQLLSVPRIRISDVFAKPDINSGEIKVIVTVQNGSKADQAGQMSFNVNANGSGQMLHSSFGACDFPQGESVHQTCMAISQPQLWSLENPYLYNVHVSIESGANDQIIQHSSFVRCGFRDFRVEKGFFRLNGKRIFVRSTHTGNQVPNGIMIPMDPYLMRQDLIYAKASGFNMVRYISGMPFQEQMDFCDEIGLLVYSECAASWCLKDSPQMAERFDSTTLGLVKRDRNHPSVVIWGMLNETHDGPVYRQAAAILPQLRELDDTRLVLLGSGRWDRQLDTGSVSNPGSSEWEFEWGAEELGAAPLPELPPNSHANGYPGGFFNSMGDIHFYPVEPRTAEFNQLIRTIGHDTKPLFLSEWGYGSLLDVIRISRQFEQAGWRSDLHDAIFFRGLEEKLTIDWARFKLDEVYAFPQLMMEESQRIHAVQRRIIFDYVRSNPQFCGYNVTGMLDHGYCGEGMWTLFREWKPGIVDVLQDGWAPLRWCLFVDPQHVYANRAFKVEAILANEDVLKQGVYPVCFRIIGEQGVVWEKRAELELAELAPNEDGLLAVPVMLEMITLDVPSGEYELCAYMEKNGAPAGGRKSFHLSNPHDLPVPACTITTLGISEEVVSWLKNHGVDCNTFTESATQTQTQATELILVGDMQQYAMTAEIWTELMQRTARGSTVVFLSPLALKRGDEGTGWLPFGNKGRSFKFNDWLYHKETVAKTHAYFAGLQANGLMRLEYYDQIAPNYIYEGLEIPEEWMAVAFAVGPWPSENGYTSGVITAAYKLGAGRIVLNTLRILENCDEHPAADRLLLNIIAYENGLKPAMPIELSADFELELQGLLT